MNLHVDQAQRLVRNRIVDLLESSAVLTDRLSRELFLEMLLPMLDPPPHPREHTRLRPQIVELVRDCAQQVAGLRCLADCLVELEPGSDKTSGVVRLVDEWEAIGYFPEADITPLREPLTSIRLRGEIRRLMAHVELPEHCDTAWSLFLHLSAMNSGESGMPPSVDFLQRVLPLLPNTGAQAVRAFVNTVVDQWRLDDLKTPVRAHEPAPGQAFLVVQIEQHSLDDDWFLVTHWLQSGLSNGAPVKHEPSLVHRAGIEPAVEKIVRRMELRWEDMLDPITIEFVLPWMLLNEPVDAWLMETDGVTPTALGVLYPVVVRSLERQRERRWHRMWRIRWRGMTPDAETVPYWSKPAGIDYTGRLEAELSQNSDTLALVLSEPPLPGSRGQHEMFAALRVGMPIVVWHRHTCATNRFQDAVISLFHGGPLSNLPLLATKLRQEAWSLKSVDREAHIGSHLTLMWDDPDRQPERVGHAGDFEGEAPR